MNGKKSGWRVWKQVAGWGLLVLGLAGFVLPVIPGIPLLLAGLAILAHHYVWARKAMDKTKEVAAEAKNAATGGGEAKTSSHVVTPDS